MTRQLYLCAVVGFFPFAPSCVCLSMSVSTRD